MKYHPIDRDALIAAKVTLNGQPARIAGRRLDFPRVTNIKTGESYEWSWNACEHIVNNKGGRFVS